MVKNWKKINIKKRLANKMIGYHSRKICNEIYTEKKAKAKRLRNLDTEKATLKILNIIGV